jgi:hypothetical protein
MTLKNYLFKSLGIKTFYHRLEQGVEILTQ